MLAVLGPAAPGSAAEPDKYLPSDSRVVIIVNVRQIVDAPAFKKNAAPQINVVNSAAIDLLNLKGIIDAAALDPLKDINQVIIATPGGTDGSKGVVIVNGRFDKAKFQANAEAAATRDPNKFKILKDKNQTIYETETANTPGYAAIVDKGPILFARSDDYLLSVLKMGGKAELKSKELKALLAKTDSKQSIILVALGSEVAGLFPFPPSRNEKLDITATADKLDAMVVGITIADDAKLEISLLAKNADAAKEVNKVVKSILNKVLGTVALRASDQEELAPLVDILKNIKTSIKDKTIIIQAQVSADIVEQAFKIVR